MFGQFESVISLFNLICKNKAVQSFKLHFDYNLNLTRCSAVLSDQSYNQNKPDILQPSDSQQRA